MFILIEKYTSISIQKYTMHEHLNLFGLIIMNGRMYDPWTGRFLSPDPVMQNTEYGPNYNPYSYCLNNPLKYIDPSGFNYDWFRNGITGQYYFNSELTAEDLPDIQAQWGEEWEYEHANLGFMLDNSLLSMRQDAGLMFSPFSADISLMEGVGDGLSISQQRGMVGSAGGGAQSLFLLGLGLTADGAEGAANLFQTSNARVKAAAVRNNLPTTQIDKIMGNTSKFATGAKWAGRGVIVVGAGISIYQGYDAYTQGDMTGVSKAGLDLGVGLGAAAIGGIPGVLLYGGYMLMMQPPHGGTGYQHPNVFLNDNTYVAPPVVPGF